MKTTCHESSPSLPDGRPGSYVLFVEVSAPMSIIVGQLGSVHFSQGFHCYIGSALNGLQGRIKRHLRATKNPHWHIDYLLERSNAVALLWTYSSLSLECQMANALERKLMPSVPRFGSSDCKCSSHLFYQLTIEPAREVLQVALARPSSFIPLT